MHNETKTITDNEQEQINLSKTIKINSVLPCPQPHFFYNGTGKVDRNKIKEFLGEHFDKVVAWYKFQKTSGLKFSLRDKIIHKQLMDFFGITSDIFTCCFLIKEVSDNGATHLFSQAFMRFHSNKYDHLPIHIPNLSESNNTYKTPEQASSTFNKILNDLQIDKKTTQGFVVITKIQKALQKHIDLVIKELSTLEQYMCELEENVKILEMKKLKKKKEEEKDQLSTIFNDDSENDINLRKAEISEISSDKSLSEISPDKSLSEISPDKTLSKTVIQKVSGRGKPLKDRKDQQRTSRGNNVRTN